jgi:hypothetical protein
MKLATTNKPEINWKNIEAGLGALAFGLILFVIGWQSAILSIFAGFLSMLGSGYLLSVPEVRFYLKLTINWASHKQVFQNGGTISGSNVVGPVDTGGGPLTIQQTADQKKPYLRADPKLYYTSVSGVQGLGTIDWLEFSIEVTNLGEGVATDIQGQATFVGPEAWQLPKDGKFQIHPLAPRESANHVIITDSPIKISRQKRYSVILAFKDQEGRDIAPCKIEGQVSDLKIGNFDQMRG